MTLQTVKDALDSTTWLGTGSAGIGFTATFTQYYPVATGSLAFIIMVMTIVHVYRKIKGSALDNEIKKLEIERLTNESFKRRSGD